MEPQAEDSDTHETGEDDVPILHDVVALGHIADEHFHSAREALVDRITDRVLLDLRKQLRNTLEHSLRELRPDIRAQVRAHMDAAQTQTEQD